MPAESAFPPQSSSARLGLAVTALVLGLASLGLSIVVVGGLLGMVGLGFGIAHLLRRPEQPRGMAVAGMVLSILGFVASAGFGVLYFMVIGDVVDSIAGGGGQQKWVGRESPDFTVTTFDGQKFTLSDFRGKRVVVDMWETWCGPCIKEIPHFNELRTAVKEEDLVIIGVSREKQSVVRTFLTKHEMIYRVASAENLPAPYSNVYAIPTTFFIDRNGIIQSVLVGYRDFDVLKQHSTASDYEEAASIAPAGEN